MVSQHNKDAFERLKIRRVIPKAEVERESQKLEAFPSAQKGIALNSTPPKEVLANPVKFRRWQLRQNPMLFVHVLHDPVDNYVKIVDPKKLEPWKKRDVVTFSIPCRVVFESIDLYMESFPPYRGIFQEFKLRCVIRQIKAYTFSIEANFESPFPDEKGVKAPQSTIRTL
jgi:hypothetical protein